MFQLSIDSINQHSPYILSTSGEGLFCFTTDEGLIYEVGFVEDQMISIGNAYQFFLIPKSSSNVGKDEKMQKTVTAIIEAFFESGDVLLDYICDSNDGRQAARSRLFSLWFNQYPKRNQFTLRTMSIVYENITYYASAIVRNDNPHYREYMKAIDDFEAEMREKLQ